MKFITFALCLVAAHSSIQAQKIAHLFLTGTYTNGKSEGIYAIAFDPSSQTGKQVSIAGSIQNPSFLSIAPNGRFVYAVSEVNGSGNAGKVIAYALERATGKLTRLNEQPSGGDDPCYVTTDKTGRWVIVGNYSSGSLSVLPVGADGALGQAVSRIAHSGFGPNKERQEKPHVHATVLSPDNRFLYVPDLGTDKIFIYAFDGLTGQLSPAAMPFIESAPGSGPRHFTFHPSGRFAYLVEELTGTISVFAYAKNNGSLTKVQHISTLPKGFNGFAGSADIHVSPDGKFLYASNRANANNIAIFSIHKKNGLITSIGHQSVMGDKPRNFSISPDGKWLLCANQGTDEIVVFERQVKTGLLTDTGKRISIPSPVCIAWITP